MNNGNSKFELVEQSPDTGLLRIRAVRDIPDYGVYAGDLGGWVWGLDALSEHGSAWVSGSARVSGSQVTATRSDGYTFMLAWCADGELRVTAGCRYFTVPEAREHWTKTRGGTRLGDETVAILDLLEKFAPEKPKEEGR